MNQNKIQIKIKKSKGWVSLTPLLCPFYCLQYFVSQSFHTQIIVVSPYIEVFVIKLNQHCNCQWFPGREIVSLTTRVGCHILVIPDSACDTFWVLSLTWVWLNTMKSREVWMSFKIWTRGHSVFKSEESHVAIDPSLKISM